MKEKLLCFKHVMMEKFPMTATTNCHKLSDLKQQKYFFSQL